MAARFDRASSTSAREPVTWSPSGAANTATALPPAAAGNRSSSSCIACALSLFGAVKSSRKAPPNEAVSATTTATSTPQAPIVVQGLRALVSPMRRMKRFMLRVATGAVLGRLGRGACGHGEVPLQSERSSGFGCGEVWLV